MHLTVTLLACYIMRQWSFVMSVPNTNSTRLFTLLRSLSSPFHAPIQPLRSSGSSLLRFTLRKMGRSFLIELEGNAYSCKHCKAQIAASADIISKAFTCRHGKAYLAEKVVNVCIGDPEERIMMVSGRHIVADVSCVGCGSLLGWKYVTAFEHMHKYKEKRFLLDRYMLLGPDGSPYQIGNDQSDESD